MTSPAQTIIIAAGDSADLISDAGIVGVHIENLTGCWYRLDPWGYWIPPYTIDWAADVPALTKIARLSFAAPIGQSQQILSGEVLTATTYPVPVGNSPGVSAVASDSRSWDAQAVVSSVAAQTFGTVPFYAVGVRVDNSTGIAWQLPDGVTVPAYVIGFTHDLLPPWRSMLFTPTADPSGIPQSADGGTLAIVAYPSHLGEFPGTSVYGTPGTQSFSASGSWTVPAGVGRLSYFMVGGGGGGGSGSTYSGGGGGGGQVLTGSVPVTPGTTITVGVGNGGSSDNPGTASTLIGPGVNVSASGGAQGGSSTNPGGAGYTGGGGGAVSTAGAGGGGGAGSGGPGASAGDAGGGAGGVGTAYSGGAGSSVASIGANGGPGGQTGYGGGGGGGSGNQGYGAGTAQDGGGNGGVAAGGAGTAGTGGGGGGGAAGSTYAGGTGGTGIVVLSWRVP